jgi:hypothetical protein
MRVLFDQGTPVPLRHVLTQHEIETAFERGWSRLQNGALLDAAEREGFEVLLSTDRNLRYQQNLTSRRLGIVVLSTTSWPRIQRALPLVTDAIDRVTVGSYIEVAIP